MRKLALTLLLPVALLPGCFTVVGALAGSADHPAMTSAASTATSPAPKPRADGKSGESHVALGALIGFGVDALLTAVVISSALGGSQPFPD